VSDDEDEGDAAALPKQPVAHSYAAEQQELKQAFLAAAAEADEEGVADEGGVLRKKASKRSADEAGEQGPGKEQQVNKVRKAAAVVGPELRRSLLEHMPGSAQLVPCFIHQVWRVVTWSYLLCPLVGSQTDLVC
jgi:hypothetical protein